MKILRLKLTNFIGIMHGLGLDTIEIDFTKGNNTIVMLRGGNGSGKSTIMSQLHPYKDSFDDRKKLIIDGKDGLKEIDIEHNGHKYEISHTYSKNAQSFIKEDGVELNVNGGVKTFEEIVAQKLGITKDYFQIGKIGSNTKNFVDLPSIERKEYIGKFIPIEDINNAYKIANEKLKALKKDIDTVATELKKFNTREVVETEIVRLEASIKQLEEELSALYTEQGSLQTIINKNTSIINGRSAEAIAKILAEKQLDYQKYKDIKTALEEELEDTSDPNAFSETLAGEIHAIQSSIQVNNNDIANKNLLITDAENKIAATKIQLSALGNPEDITKLAEEIDTLTKDLEKLRESIRNNPTGTLVHGLYQSKKDINRLLGKFTDFSDFIEKYYKELGEYTFTLNKPNIEYFLDNSFEESFERQIQESRKVIEAKQKLLESLQKERGVKEGFVCQLKNLDQRPAECVIDDCPFIKNALEHKNVLNEINEKDLEILQAKHDLELLNTKAENLQVLQVLYKNFQAAYKALMPRENEIYAEFIREKTLVQWILGGLSIFQVARQELIANVKQVLADIDAFTNKKARCKSAEETKRVLEDSDSTVREKYLKDIEEAENKIKIYTQELEELKIKATKLTEELSTKQTLKGKYDTLIQARSKVDSNATMISGKKSELDLLNKVLAESATAETRLDTVKIEIKTKSELKRSQDSELLSYKSALTNIDSLNKRKKKLELEYLPMDTIVRALSQKSGIPMVFINSYLAETQTIANDLLNIAFNGDFQINFVTTDREFSIQVISKNNIKPDIKMASQGEVAITTISISLALIEQSIGAYNILCLDEIDGPLDPNNRNNFIDILNRQISKLGIEQVFVISHNDAFDTAPLDLILLKDNNVNKTNSAFMANKTVIFEDEGIN